MSSFFPPSPDDAPAGPSRRAISDSITALARGDDAQEVSMLSDISLQPSTSNSDDQSIGEEDKQDTMGETMVVDTLEVQGKGDDDEMPSIGAPAVKLAEGTLSEAAKAPQPIVDPKRIKRILANRQSAQRSREKKLQYVEDLKKSVDTFEKNNATLRTQVASYEAKSSNKFFENIRLKQRIVALSRENLLKDVQKEILKKERERLLQLYYHQKMETVLEEKSDGPPVEDDNMP